MLHHRLSPSPSPSPSPSTPPSNPPPSFTSSSTDLSTTPPSKLPVDFSPPLIAMVVTIATAFVIITYSRLLSRHFIHNYRRYRQWRNHRRRYSPSSNGGGDNNIIQSPPYPFDPSQAFHVLSPYGLDESIIKTIPLSIYNNNNRNKIGSIINDCDCAVCLLEFEENDYVRTLPICNHAFHVDCIDIWLKSHANCPMCRAGIFRPDSPFTPLMSARIRPSLDDIVIESAVTEIEPLTASETEIEIEIGIEITQSQSPIIQSEDRSFNNRRDFLLKRSYSFGFERNLGSERSLVLEPATASPFRYRRSSAGAGSFWSKRASPFSSLNKPRVFSFRYYNRMKSPIFFRRRSISGFFPLSEPNVRLGSSRRRSSRLRSGDPEALLSPERFNRR